MAIAEGPVVIDLRGHTVDGLEVHGNQQKGSDTLTRLRSVVPFIRDHDEGQGLAEYALILALIAIVAIVALIFLGGQVSTILSTVGDSI